MATTIALTTPYVGLSSRRATSVNELFTITHGGLPVGIEWDYEVGLPQLNLSFFTFTNRSLNLALNVHIAVPSIAILNISPSFVIGPNSQLEFTLELRNDEAKRRSVNPIPSYLDMVQVTVTPLNVIGPVFLPD